MSAKQSLSFFFFFFFYAIFRDAIASCSEISYEKLPVKNAVSLLYLSSLDQLISFAQKVSPIGNETVIEKVRKARKIKNVNSNFLLTRFLPLFREDGKLIARPTK